MPIPSFDDPRSFVQDFGVPIILDVRLGSFDMATAPAPCIRCVASDVVALKKHDQATVCDPVAGTQTVYYLDHDPHPDGHGMAFVFVSLDTNEV
jgi:hypothetical protein